MSLQSETSQILCIFRHLCFCANHCLLEIQFYERWFPSGSLLISYILKRDLNLKWYHKGRIMGRCSFSCLRKKFECAKWPITGKQLEVTDTISMKNGRTDKEDVSNRFYVGFRTFHLISIFKLLFWFFEKQFHQQEFMFSLNFRNPNVVRLTEITYYNSKLLQGQVDRPMEKRDQCWPCRYVLKQLISSRHSLQLHMATISIHISSRDKFGSSLFVYHF